MDLDLLEHLWTKTFENHSNQNAPFEALKFIFNIKNYNRLFLQKEPMHLFDRSGTVIVCC